MSGAAIFSHEEGRRVSRPLAPRRSPSRFVVAEIIEAVGFAIVDEHTGELVAHATKRCAERLAQLLNLIRPSAEQLAALLGEDRGARYLRTLILKHEGVCSRCGARLEPGTRARWHAVSGLTRHIRRCPDVAAKPPRRRAA